MPDFLTGHRTSPARANPLGVKGVGEGATIGAPPAPVAAALDALRPLGIRGIDMPPTPARLRGAIAAILPETPA